MKSIKLKIVTLVMILFAMFTMSNAQNEPSQAWLDSVFGSVSFTFAPLQLETNPLELTLKSEPLEKNESLQKMIELSIEEKDLLNQNLLTLNNSIRDLPYINVKAKQAELDKYNIDPLKVQRGYNISYGAWYAMTVVWLVIMTVILASNRKLYFSKKYGNHIIYIAIIGTFILAYLMPKLQMITSVKGYYLWQNIDKLF